jgi:diacylglycerol kinase family enzyme
MKPFVIFNPSAGWGFNTDGELVGNMPAMFQTVPHALDFVAGKQ